MAAICDLTGLAVSLAMEAIGDITASAEVSRVAVVGEEFDSRIQGGVLVSKSGVQPLQNVSESLFVRNRAMVSVASSRRCSL